MEMKTELRKGQVLDYKPKTIAVKIVGEYKYIWTQLGHSCAIDCYLNGKWECNVLDCFDPAYAKQVWGDIK